jgi:gamma-glutamyltranspeptidase / glutathione hydrolase
MKKLFLFLLNYSYISIVVAQLPVLVGAGRSIDPYHYNIVKKNRFNKAAVTSAHPLASMVGAEIMKLGGNAFDAAVATQLALAVVYPGAGNIGGGGFLLAHTTKGQILGIDYREAAPELATRNMYLDSLGKPITDLSLYGHLAAGIPGTMAGIEATLPYCRLPFKTLIYPAYQLALAGFVLTPAEAEKLNTYQPRFLKNNTHPNAFTAKNFWKAGDTLVQTQLANTLYRLYLKGPREFYEGETANLIVAEMNRGKGIITKADLKQYRAKERVPISFTYRNNEIISFAPPSSGGILLAQMLKMIEPYPVTSYGFHSPQMVQLMIEVERRAYADRAEHMGDPDFWKVPLQQLISTNYLSKRMADYVPGKAGNSKQTIAGNPYESDETTHLSIVDPWGNAVSVTTTLNGIFGSCTVVGNAGFLLNNEMDDFSVKPGSPNMYGAVGGEANSIAPGKRMLSSMTPTLVLRHKTPYIVIGTPGGTTIPTSVFQALVNMLDFGMSSSEAIDAPKFHHQWLPDIVRVEKLLNLPLRKALESMGYRLIEKEDIGRTEAIQILYRNKKRLLETAADKRGDDSVAGF